ncbi:MAG: nitroreductase family protein [Pseudomonadota bacterium]
MGQPVHQPLERRRAVSDEEARTRADEFYAEIKRRRTVRDYDTRAVPKEVIEACIAAAGTAPSGANQQPWHFVAVRDPETKAKIREAAEAEERKFYDGGASDEWLEALAPIGTDAHKPHLTDAAWLIVVFAQRFGTGEDGSKVKHYYVPESVGIATGMLLTALHMSGLVTLTHTPNPMGFLRTLLDRPDNEKATMIIAVGHPSADATTPTIAKIKKPLEEILTIR